MEMNDRIKQVRVDAGLTQEKFADRLGLKRNSVANYEIGRNVPLDAILLSICREFNINENWLRTGEGDMHCFTGDDDEYEIALKEIGSSDPMAKQVILNYWHMSNSEKELLWSFIKRLLKEKGDDL